MNENHKALRVSGWFFSIFVKCLSPDLKGHLYLKSFDFATFQLSSAASSEFGTVPKWYIREGVK